MAEIREMSSVDAPEIPKSDRESAPAPEVKAKKSKLPTPRTFTLIPEDFYQYVAALSRQDWAHVALYVYRLANPRIVRDPSNVDSIDREPPSIPFTELYLKETQGSGKFEVKLNDTDSRNTVCRMLTDINDPDYPPKFDIRELDVGYKGNRLIVERLKREGKLTQDGEVIVKSEGSDASLAQALKDVALEAMRGRKGEQPGMENQAFGKMMEMMASASKQSIEIALGQVKKDDPASFIALLTTAKELFTPAKVETVPAVNPLELLSKAKELFAPAKASTDGDPLMKLLMSQLENAQKDASAERQRNHELQLKMLEAKTNAADPMDMIEKVLNIKERLGGDEPDQRNWKEKLVDQGMQYVPQLLDVAGKIAGGYRRQEPANPQRTQQQPPAAPASTQPQAVQTPTQPQPTAPTGEPMPPEQPIQPLDPEIAFLLPIFERFGARLVAAFRDDPNSGGEVAGAVRTPLLAGRADYERICRMGREKILATIELIPQMKTDCLAAGTPAMLNDFIDDFIAGPDEDPDDGEEEPEPHDPIGPDAKRRKKVPTA